MRQKYVLALKSTTFTAAVRQRVSECRSELNLDPGDLDPIFPITSAFLLEDLAMGEATHRLERGLLGPSPLVPFPVHARLSFGEGVFQAPGLEPVQMEFGRLLRRLHLTRDAQLPVPVRWSIAPLLRDARRSICIERLELVRRDARFDRIALYSTEERNEVRCWDPKQ